MILAFLPLILIKFLEDRIEHADNISRHPKYSGKIPLTSLGDMVFNYLEDS